jgi:hypothetical protein
MEIPVEKYLLIQHFESFSSLFDKICGKAFDIGCGREFMKSYKSELFIKKEIYDLCTKRRKFNRSQENNINEHSKEWPLV